MIALAVVISLFALIMSTDKTRPEVGKDFGSLSFTKKHFRGLERGRRRQAGPVGMQRSR
jgi:hypothetical protein